MTLGERVTRLRESLGLSGPELARRVGTTKQSISKIESGATMNPKLATFFALAREFDVDPEWLAFETGSRDRSRQSHPVRLDFEKLRTAFGIAERRRTAPFSVETVIEALETVYLLEESKPTDLADSDPKRDGGSTIGNDTRANAGAGAATRRKSVKR